MSNAQSAYPMQDIPLTVREHLDPDKHWIGEGLPAPSDSEITFAGTETSAGDSPFPARADHSHDTRTQFSVYKNSSPQSVSSLATEIITDVVHVAGETWPSGFRVGFPQEGVYLTCATIQFTKTGTYAPNDRFVIWFEYGNGAESIMVAVFPATFGGSISLITVPHIKYFSSGIMNVQFKVQNAASVSVQVYLLDSYSIRLSSALGTEA